MLDAPSQGDRECSMFLDDDTGAIAHRYRDARTVGIICDRGDLNAHADLGMRERGEHLDDHARDLELLALQTHREARDLGEHGQIEVHELIGLPIAELIDGRIQTERDDALGNADRIEQIERRGMYRRSAQIFRQLEIAFDQEHRNAALCETQCGNAAHRTRAGHDDA